MKREKFNVIFPTGLKPFPLHYEITAAELLAIFFQSDVEFLPRSNQKTADVRILGKDWEFKSPTGSGKRNIQHQLQAGMKQSKNIVFDARRSKIHIAKIRRALIHQFSRTKSIKRIVLIDKMGNVVELTK